MLAPDQLLKFENAVRAEWARYNVLIDTAHEIVAEQTFLAAADTIAKTALRSNAITKGSPEERQNTLVKLRQSYPGYLSWGLNKHVDDPQQRHEIAARLRETVNALTPLPTSNDLSVEFQKSGIAMLPQFLTSKNIDEMAAFLSSRQEFVVDGPVRNNLVEDAVLAPFAMQLATQPDLLALAHLHLGVPPTIIDIGAWWSDPTPKDDYGAHIFHRDKDDFRACKVFLYLTDVEAADGPHVLVRRTHDLEFVQAHVKAHALEDGWVDALFKDNGRHVAEYVPQLFHEQVLEVTGPKGTCFIENTYAFHRGKPPRRFKRGIFQVTYGMVAYPRRLKRLLPISLSTLPQGCVDTPSARYAARLLLTEQK